MPNRFVAEFTNIWVAILFLEQRAESSPRWYLSQVRHWLLTHICIERTSNQFPYGGFTFSLLIINCSPFKILEHIWTLLYLPLIVMLHFSIKAMSTRLLDEDLFISAGTHSILGSTGQDPFLLVHFLNIVIFFLARPFPVVLLGHRDSPHVPFVIYGTHSSLISHLSVLLRVKSW